MNPMTESNRSTSSKLVRDVVALGKKYARAGFPNPSREGCPSPASLRAMAYRDRRLTLKDLPASHVVTCSPCFQQYSQLPSKGACGSRNSDNGGCSRSGRHDRSGNPIYMEPHP